jgi:hypothetical protein
MYRLMAPLLVVQMASSFCCDDRPFPPLPFLLFGSSSETERQRIVMNIRMQLIYWISFASAAWRTAKDKLDNAERYMAR